MRELESNQFTRGLTPLLTLHATVAYIYRSQLLVAKHHKSIKRGLGFALLADLPIVGFTSLSSLGQFNLA